MKSRINGAFIALALMAIGATANAQFAGGTLVVSQVGDGSGALTSAAWNAYLDDYSTSGTLNSSLAVGTTNSGTATSELQLNIAGNGKSFQLGGYSSAEGTASVASSTGPRIVDSVSLNGTIDSSSNIATLFSGNNIRSVWSPDGTGFYAAGPKGIAYVADGGTTGTLLAAPNARQVEGYGGNLYYTTASATLTGSIGLEEISGLPTSGTQTPTSVLSVASTDSPYDFVFANSTTLYIADDGSATGDVQGGVQKYSLVNGVWTLDYVGLGTGFTGVRSLAVNGSSIYGIAVTSSGADDLVSLTDTGSSFSSFTTLATPGTDENFRGVRFVPAPEPASMAALGLGIAGLVARRRRAGK